MQENIFKQNHIPKIYAYTEPDRYEQREWQGKRYGKGLWKVGDTERTAEERVSEQYSTNRPDENVYKIALEEVAIREDGTTFRDYQVHEVLENSGVTRIRGSETEWFECTLEEIRRAIAAVKQRKNQLERHYADFKMRPEQKKAVEETSKFFRAHTKDKEGYAPHFLWNAKMRFGKCFTSYQLAKEMGWRKILVLTFKPAVKNSWEEDLHHIDFRDWQFVSREGIQFDNINPNKPFVCFKSFQDVLGKTDAGGIKPTNEFIHHTQWDCIILDEYHFGAWRESSKELYAGEEKREQALQEEGLDYYDEKQMPLTTNAYLYLSGTPFRALQNGDFMENQIFNWTYSDEQEQKSKYGDTPNNPYAELPKMVLMTYKLPEEIRTVAYEEEQGEFDLNEFFRATDTKGGEAKFVHEEEVQKWLSLIYGQYLPTNIDNSKNNKRLILPFSGQLLKSLSHTFWFLPSVASCKAMKILLEEHPFYSQYKIICCAGAKAGIGAKALELVQDSIGKGFDRPSITLSCGKLTTGVTVPQWSGIFMLRNTSSPETYFQSAFRVQSPWVLKNPTGKNPNERIIIKHTCYVFDFAPNRALGEIVSYCTKLETSQTISPEKNLQEFTKFLPVICYNGSEMDIVPPEDFLNILTTGIGASMLARKWDSNYLLNVKNDVLKKLLANEKALNALSRIEAFRKSNLRNDLSILINKSEAIERIKNEHKEELSKKERKELSAKEKETRNRRTEIQEKLKSFAKKIPIFMYLTDNRERSLQEVITQLETGLFQKITNLTLSDFELLVSIGVFNRPTIDEAVLAFRLYEEQSLKYTGIPTYQGDKIGGFSTQFDRKQLNKYFII